MKIVLSNQLAGMTIKQMLSEDEKIEVESGQELRTELLDKMKNIVKGLMTQHSQLIATLFTEDEIKDVNKCFEG